MKPELIRCPWPTNEISIHYHDTEWGVPVHDDRQLFEYPFWCDPVTRVGATRMKLEMEEPRVDFLQGAGF